MLFSVLMSLYGKEKAENLDLSLKSILNQKLTPNEIIFIIDGPINNELEDVVERYSEKLTVYRLKKNVGLGQALNFGLSKCSYDIVARMDTDDISLENRFLYQMKFLEENPSYSVIGSSTIEFYEDNNFKQRIKKMPFEKKKFIKYMKSRNPLIHPTVMFKKNDVISVGSYIECKYNEDYYLWLRMNEKGYKMINLEEKLLKMRVNIETLKRRGGYDYFKKQLFLNNYMLNSKQIGFLTYYRNLVIRFILSVLITPKMRAFVYYWILRRGRK